MSICILKSLSFLSKIIYKKNNTISYKLSSFIFSIKEKIIFNKIKYNQKLISDVDFLDIKRNEKRKIWVLWLQGIDDAPRVIKSCFRSLQDKNDDYEIILLDEENLFNYVKLPSYIKEKYSSGLITKTHLSDIIRFYLLYYYGGIWVDSTVYFTKKIPDCFRSGFSTLVSSDSSPYSVSKGNWCGYFISSDAGDEITGSILNCFYSYWQENNKLVDYFLIDYILKFHLIKYPNFKKELLANSVSGEHRFFLQKNLFESFSPELKDTIHKIDPGIYKLTYKLDFSKYELNDGCLLINAINNGEI